MSLLTQTKTWIAVLALQLLWTFNGTPAWTDEYAFLIAAQDYDESQLRPLHRSRKDISDLWKLLIECGYHRENIVVLHDGNSDTSPSTSRKPTEARIKTELESLLRRMKSNDSLLVAFAGHGIQFADKPHKFLCPLDAKLTDKTTLIPVDWLFDLLRKSPVQRHLILLDASHLQPANDRIEDVEVLAIESSAHPRDTRIESGVVAIYGWQSQQDATDESSPQGFFRNVVESWWSDTDYLTLERFASRLQLRAPDVALDVHSDQQESTYRASADRPWVLNTRSRPRAPSPTVGYSLAAGDVLSVSIPGVMRSMDNRFTGAPVVIPHNGKIWLPVVGIVDVMQVSIATARQRIIDAYAENNVIRAELLDSISVFLRSERGKGDIDVASRVLEVGDVLGVFINGMLPFVDPPGDMTNFPFEGLLHARSERELIPAGFGIPIMVLEDGCISIPLLGDVAAANRTIAEVEREVQKRLVEEDILLARAGSGTVFTLLNTNVIPKGFRLSHGDVIDLYVPNFGGQRPGPSHSDVRSGTRIPRWIGEPVLVHRDGTIALPLLDPLKVQGLKVSEVKAAIRKRYTEEDLIRDPVVLASLGYVHQNSQVSFANYRIQPGDHLAVLCPHLIRRQPGVIPTLRPFLILPEVGSKFPAAVGVRHQVSEDGSIALLPIGRIRLAGLSLAEAEQKISKALIDQDVMLPESVLTTLGVVAPTQQ